MKQSGPIVAITGGVGGAKLALGLATVLPPSDVVFAINTGDDFEHLGLKICPDIDTLTYTLAKQNNTELGWGRQGESWQFLAALKELGGETWFQLGDKDLALHIFRTNALAGGATLTTVTEQIAKSFGIQHRLLPMSNQTVATIVHTPDGPLNFQHYFVRDRCEPAVTGFDFLGAQHARLSPELEATLDAARGVIVCPSNPFVSIDPILAVPGMLEHLKRLPCVAVSPIVDGIAIKGPTAKMMAELGVPNSAAEVAAHYDEWLDGFILDECDQHLLERLKRPAIALPTVMISLSDRVELARASVAFLEKIS